MAKRKADPFLVHLWDELTNAKLLQLEGIAQWMDAPAKIQAQFMNAARNAMNAALGVTAKPMAKKAAKAKKAVKTKTRPKAKVKRRKRPGSRAGS